MCMQDAAVFHRDFGVSVQGVIDTQLLAGLVALAAASSEGNGRAGSAATTDSHWASHVKRMSLMHVSRMYGYTYCDIPTIKRGGPE